MIEYLIATLFIVLLIWGLTFLRPKKIPAMTEADIEVERWADWFGRALTPVEEMRLRELIARRDKARAAHQSDPSRITLKAWKEVHADILHLENEIAMM